MQGNGWDDTRELFYHNSLMIQTHTLTHIMEEFSFTNIWPQKQIIAWNCLPINVHIYNSKQQIIRQKKGLIFNNKLMVYCCLTIFSWRLSFFQEMHLSRSTRLSCRYWKFTIHFPLACLVPRDAIAIFCLKYFFDLSKRVLLNRTLHAISNMDIWQEGPWLKFNVLLTLQRFQTSAVKKFASTLRCILTCTCKFTSVREDFFKAVFGGTEH